LFDRINKLKAAMAQGNFEQAERLAHSLRSSCANMGAQRLSALFRKVEVLSQSGHFDEIEALIAHVEQEAGSVQNALKVERT
jgi:HPt (histidine-containing phosphotransfer) domain-containing protein